MSYRPIQLDYADDPWKVCVVSILCAMTDRQRVREIVDELFEAFPRAEAMAAMSATGWIKGFLEPLGLSNRRIRYLREMSGQWVESDMSQRRNPTRSEITKLSGCGEYAADAVQIFCNGDLSTEPTDRVLLAYVNERRTEAGEHLTEIIEERSR